MGRTTEGPGRVKKFLFSLQNKGCRLRIIIMIIVIMVYHQIQTQPEICLATFL
jgi:hypothetical protein